MLYKLHVGQAQHAVVAGLQGEQLGKLRRAHLDTSCSKVETSRRRGRGEDMSLKLTCL